MRWNCEICGDLTSSQVDLTEECEECNIPITFYKKKKTTADELRKLSAPKQMALEDKLLVISATIN